MTEQMKHKENIISIDNEICSLKPQNELGKQALHRHGFEAKNTEIDLPAQTLILAF